MPFCCHSLQYIDVCWLWTGLLGGGGGGGLPDLGSLMGAALQLIMGFASSGGGAHNLFPFHLDLGCLKIARNPSSLQICLLP